MAYTATDLANVEAAIRAIIAGTRTVSLSMGDKSIAYTAVDLPALRALRDEIRAEVGAAAGTFSPRTYARQGGRAV
jgi:hypothetical protein